MKIFLLFLCASFMVGANWQHATRPQQRWLIGTVAVILVTTYFLFDQLI